MKKHFLKITLICTGALVGALLTVVFLNHHIETSTSAQIQELQTLRPAQATLLLGARVYADGGVSPVVADRIQTAFEVYRSGKARKILVSGDHGHKDYDEVNTIKDKLLELGVPAQDVFMDHAGFSTYDSLYRARDVFQVQSLIIVTQAFHLNRALYLANALSIPTQGIAADRRTYRSRRYNAFREFLARPANFLKVALRLGPRYLGETIPISGDGRLTQD